MATPLFAVTFRPTPGPAMASSSNNITDDTVHHPKVVKVATAVAGGLAAAVPFHTAKEDPTGLTADCFLQVWELDYFKVNTSFQNEEYDLTNEKNQMLAVWPGVIVQTGTAFAFRPTADPDLTQTSLVDAQGKLKFALTKLNETAETTFDVFLPEYEGVLELAAILTTTKDDATLAAPAATAAVSPYLVRNVRGSVFHQVQCNGGLAVGCCANYYDSTGIAERDHVDADFQKEYGRVNADGVLEWWGLPEFGQQAEEMIAMRPTFRMRDGTLKMDYHRVNGPADLPGIFQDVRNGAQAVLGSAQPPLVQMVTIYCHGMRYGGGFNKWSKFGRQAAKAMAKSIAPHVAQNLTVALFACNMGMSLRRATAGDLTTALKDGQSGDATYGRPYPCEELGAASFAWTLMRALVANGISNPTVWAHTTAAHTTRNPNLRVFSPLGTTDVINVLAAQPRMAAGLGTYVSSFRGSGKSLPYANLLRGICLVDAMYLSWDWFDSRMSDEVMAAKPGYTAEAGVEAEALLLQLQSRLAGGAAGEPEQVTYADETRAYLTGVASGADPKKVALTEVLKFADLPTGFGKARVQLLRYVQLLMERTAVKVKVTAIQSDGDEAVLEPANGRTAGLEKLVAAAQSMRDDEKLFAKADRSGSTLVVS